MSTISYLTQFAMAIFRHSGKWWGSLLFTGFGGVGIWDAWTPGRAWVVGEMPALDPYIPLAAQLWWLVGLVVIWIIISLAHKEVIIQQTQPRILFDSPVVEVVGLEDDLHNFLGSIALVKISIRNNPIGRRLGLEARQAYGTAEYFRKGESASFLKVLYPRWVENPKPRRDNTPTYILRPHFEYVWNFRDLPPNNSPNHMDFLVRNITTGELFAFEGGSQGMHLWQNLALRIVEDEFFVKLSIEANQFDVPIAIWLAVSNDKNGSLRVWALRDDARYA